MIAKPYGRDALADMCAWIAKQRESGKRGQKQRFYETEVYMLAPGVAYSVSMRDEYEGEKAVQSRVTLVFLKKGYEWRIIHGHFSYAPES